MLPYNEFSPFYPFGGVVLNFNVVTSCHEDPQDEGVCLLLILSEGKGGALGLVQPGIRVDLENGDLFAFRSADITHFNLDYQGKRVSMVFHSDRFARAWVADLNGWKENISLRSGIQVSV